MDPWWWRCAVHKSNSTLSTRVPDSLIDCAQELQFHGAAAEVAVGFSSGETTTYAVQGGAGDGFRRDLNWWVLVVGPPILVFSIIGWLLFRDRKRRRAEEQTRSSERRRSLELTATFRPGDSAADGAFFSIPLDEEKPQFV